MCGSRHLLVEHRSNPGHLHVSWSDARVTSDREREWLFGELTSLFLDGFQFEGHLDVVLAIRRRCEASNSTSGPQAEGE